MRSIYLDSVAMFLVSVSSSNAIAACAAPSAYAGQFRSIAPDYKYCDGSTWQSMTVAITSTTCTTAGRLELSGPTLQFCNGSNWVSSVGIPLTTCAAASVGRVEWDSAALILKYCDGTNWLLAGVSTDPCVGKTIGQTCASTTALYAGVFGGKRLMVMPSGCTNSTSNPSCSGTDTVIKPWDDGSGSNYDVPGVENASGATAVSTQSGSVETPILAAIASSTEGGVHAAAKFCDDMVYGGFSDWFLPSKSELAYLFCKSSPSAYNSIYPQENVNCGGSGPTNQLTGFAASRYWATTEGSGANAYQMRFDVGNQTASPKNSSYYVRCVRGY